MSPPLGSATRPVGLPPGSSAEFVDHVEAELEVARTALATLEEGAARARLHKLEQELIAYPNLPQAPFLMSECVALEAQVARTTNPALAVVLETKRAALEGPRAAAFGETATAHGDAAQQELTLTGIDGASGIEIDGATVAVANGRATLQLAPGIHHARVWRRDQPLFAKFFEVRAEQALVTLEPPPLVPCSAEDLALVPRAQKQAMAPPDIACPRWALVRPEPLGISVALCERSRCGAFVLWQPRASKPFTPIANEHSRVPTWAGVALTGAALVVTSGLILWEAGAFDRGHPSADTWRYGGLNPQGIRF